MFILPESISLQAREELFYQTFDHLPKWLKNYIIFGLVVS